MPGSGFWIEDAVAALKAKNALLTAAPEKASPLPPAERDHAMLSFTVIQYVAAIATGAVSVVSLVGWIIGAVHLAGQTVRYNPMVPVTSLVFLSLCTALLLRMRLGAQRARSLVLAVSSAVWVVVLLELTDFLSGMPVAPDRLFTTAEDMTAGRQLGRMSPLVAVLFALLALAMTLYQSDRPRLRSIAASASVLVAGAGFTFCVGYAYDAPLLNSLQPFPPALYTSIGMMLLGLGIGTLGPDRRPFAWFVGPSVRAQLVRSVVPVVTVASIVLAGSVVAGERLGISQGPVPTSLGIIVLVTAVTAMVLRAASHVGARVDRAETERQLAEDALRESERSYREQFSNNSVPMVLVDPAGGGVIDANEAAARFYGYSREQLLRMRVADLSTDSPQRVDETITAVLSDGEGRKEYRHRLADGSEKDVEVSSSIIRLSGRQVVHAIIMDITERKRAEAQLAAHQQNLELLVAQRTAALTAANESLREANNAKSDFLAAMSHELRTPLNSIIGFSAILLQGMTGELDHEQRRQVEMVNLSGRRLLQLINEVLDLAKVESSRQTPVLRRIDAAAAARQMFDTIRPMAEAKGLELRWECADDLPQITTDASRVEQILLNLLGNAVKFTDQGHVSVRVSGEPQAVVVVVEDSGCGIAQEDLERVFEDFYQVPPHSSATAEGTGLGLAVSRRLAESIGAHIGVVSARGRGSTFTLRIADCPEEAPTAE